MPEPLNLNTPIPAEGIFEVARVSIEVSEMLDVAFSGIIHEEREKRSQ